MSNPIKPNLKSEWFALCLIILGILASFYFFQHFPERVPSHWNINGEVDGYSGKFMGAFIVPFMMIGIYALFLVMPYFDPKKDQYVNFAGVYHKFKDLIVGFLFILHLLVGVNGLGYPVNIGLYTPLMVGVMFIILGLLLKNVKMNWFLGIRTPWTMSSESIWNKTHAMSGWVLSLSGLAMAATVLVGAQFKIYLFILSIALIIFALPIYSYVLYVKEKQAVNK